LIFIFNLLPQRGAIFLSQILGRLAYFILPEDRKTTLKNLKFALGNIYSEKDLRKIALEVFENIAKNFAEVARFKSLFWEDLKTRVKIEGEEYWNQAFQKGKGVIAVTGHMGNFELLTAYFSLNGYKVTVLSREVYDPRLDELLKRNRKLVGVETLSAKEDTRKVIRVLKRGETLGITPDQDSKKYRGVFVDFFGKKANTPVGPALLHLRYGSPIVPIALLRNGKDKYIIKIRKPIYFEPKKIDDENIKEITQRYTKDLEQIIRQNPSQWVWMHKRWKTQPQ